jgi:anti-sigma-K factor RskA
MSIVLRKINGVLTPIFRSNGGASFGAGAPRAPSTRALFHRRSCSRSSSIAFAIAWVMAMRAGLSAGRHQLHGVAPLGALLAACRPSTASRSPAVS